MTDRLANLLGTSRFSEPPEVAIIKQFLDEKFQAVSIVTISPDRIIITVSSAALAGSLRMHLHELKKLCQTNKRLSIRIG